MSSSTSITTDGMSNFLDRTRFYEERFLLLSEIIARSQYPQNHSIAQTQSRFSRLYLETALRAFALGSNPIASSLLTRA